MENNIIINNINIYTNNLINEIELMNFKPFNIYINKLPNLFINIIDIQIQSVDKFSNNKIGFIKLKLNALNKDDNTNIPGIVLLRGPSVAILIILTCIDNPKLEKKVILTKQIRLSVPEYEFLEIPAGMLDDNGDFKGQASIELEQETGIKVNIEELIELDNKGYYTSPGVCDEFIRYYLLNKNIKYEELIKLETNIYGDSNEKISLKLVNLNDAHKETLDMKLISALFLYEKYFIK